MAGKSYLYTTLANSADSYNLGALIGGPNGLLKISVSNSIGIPSFAAAGADYVQSLSSSTGILIGVTSGVTTVNLPSPVSGNLLVGNGTAYAPLVSGVNGDVLTVTGTSPLSIGWKQATSGDPATWAQYLADADVDLQDPITSTTYHRLKNVDSVSLHQQSDTFAPAGDPSIWSLTVSGSHFLAYGSTDTSISNIIQGSFADIANGNYAANGSILVGNGETYSSLPIGIDGYVLTLAAGTPQWQPSAGGDPATWSQYPATQDVDINGHNLYGIKYLQFTNSSDPFPVLADTGIFHVDSALLPKYTSSLIENHFLITTADTPEQYAIDGSILVGNGTDYNSIAPTVLGDVLTINGSLVPAWATPPGSVSSGVPTVDCVMWISADYTGMPAYTYNNGTAGVGATLTYNTNFVFGYTLVDNYNGDFGTSGISLGTRILVVDKNNLTYSGIYTLTQLGSGSLPPILTRSTDWDSASEMIFGRRIYVKPYTPYQAPLPGPFYSSVSTFSGQFINFMTPPTITIGTTEFNFISSVFNVSTAILGSTTPVGGGYFGFVNSSAGMAQTLMPNGGRTFYASSFTTSAYYHLGSGTVTGWSMNLGRLDSTATANYTAYTNTFSYNPQTLATPANLIIPTPIGSPFASALGPNEYMGFSFSGAPSSNSGAFDLYMTYYGQWVE